MSRLARRIRDTRLLKLIRAYLNSGILIGDIVVQTGEGTPQGGPLSPLLSNIVLDELDKELEKRGLRFVRYADEPALAQQVPGVPHYPLHGTDAHRHPRKEPSALSGSGARTDGPEAGTEPDPDRQGTQ